MPLLIATRNRHKLEEIQALLDLPAEALLTVDDLPGLPEVEENGQTFADNARLKARQLRDASGCWTLGDDSGLEIDALGGAPGVFSARFAGRHGDDAANNRKVLAELKSIEHRAAQFRCAIALASPEGPVWCVEGVCRGHLLHEPRGTNGFGYDPLFVPEGMDQSFAEMGSDLKNRMSHRARALAEARRAWNRQLALACTVSHP